MNWIPVSGGRDLEASGARAVVLPDNDVVIWRTADGAAHAWENRCPHRGMRMSFGQVRNDRLLCRYHGWGFDEQGQCQSIPAMPNGNAPSKACIKTYACHEETGLIWIGLNDEGEAGFDRTSGDAAIDEAPLFCRSIYVDGELDDVMTKVKSARYLPYGFDGDDQSLSWSASDIGYGQVLLKADGADAEAILIAGHQAAEGRCGLHVVTAATGSAEIDLARRSWYGKWAVQLRYALSGPGLRNDNFPVLSDEQGAAA